MSFILLISKRSMAKSSALLWRTTQRAMLIKVAITVAKT
jgi:hypothetical protein